MTAFTWTGLGDGVSYSDAGNWSPGGGPPSDDNDTATFPAGFSGITITGVGGGLSGLTLDSGFLGTVKLGSALTMTAGLGGGGAIVTITAGTLDQNGFKITTTDGSVVLASGGTLLGSDISLDGDSIINFNSSGTYTHNNGTLEFGPLSNGSSNTSLMNSHTFFKIKFTQDTGNNGLYRLDGGFTVATIEAKYTSALSTLDLVIQSGSTINVTTSMDLQGASITSLARFRATTGASPFTYTLTVDALQVAKFLRVQDSNAQLGDSIVTTDSTDDGGNTNWLFFGVDDLELHSGVPIGSAATDLVPTAVAQKCLDDAVSSLITDLGTSVIGATETLDIEYHRATACMFHYMARNKAASNVLKFSVDGIARDKIAEVKLLQDKAKEEDTLADEALASALGSKDGITHKFVIVQPEDNPNEGEEFKVGRQDF